HRREIGEAGREEHVGAGPLEGLQARDRVVEVRPAAQEALRAGGQGEREGELARRPRRGGDPFGGGGEGEEGGGGSARGILDGAAGEPGPGGEADRFGDVRRRVAEAFFEVGGDGEVGRLDDGARL